MTPREKALQRCQKFGYLGIKWEQAEYTTLSLENAKECALIAADEIIKECYNWNGSDNIQWETKRLDYWEEVKQEIEKL